MTNHQITTPLIREGSLFPAMCVAVPFGLYGLACLGCWVGVIG